MPTTKKAWLYTRVDSLFMFGFAQGHHICIYQQQQPYRYKSVIFEIELYTFAFLRISFYFFPFSSLRLAQSITWCFSLSLAIEQNHALTLNIHRPWHFGDFILLTFLNPCITFTKYSTFMKSKAHFC